MHTPTLETDVLLAREGDEAAFRRLGDGSANTREVLILYYREESSARQVAVLLGISEEAVRQRLSRARGLLREEVLSRFAATVTRTAPSAAFGNMIAAALATSAPAASLITGGAAAATIAKAAFLGGALGWAGVLMGMHYLDPVFDEEEGRALRRFRNTVLAVVTIGAVAVALSLSSAMRLLITVQLLYATVGYLYLVKLPRILERRMEWEKSVNPEIAQQNRRQWMWATVGRAAGAALGGAVLMAMAVTLR